MEKKKLTEGIIFVAVGGALMLAAFLTESVLDGIFAGFAGGAWSNGNNKRVQDHRDVLVCTSYCAGCAGVRCV